MKHCISLEMFSSIAQTINIVSRWNAKYRLQYWAKIDFVNNNSNLTSMFLQRKGRKKLSPYETFSVFVIV